jgi:hypothetical protein
MPENFDLFGYIPPQFQSKKPEKKCAWYVQDSITLCCDVHKHVKVLAIAEHQERIIQELRSRGEMKE